MGESFQGKQASGRPVFRRPRATPWLLAVCSLFWAQVHVECWGRGKVSLHARCSFLSSGPASASHLLLFLPRHEAQRLEQEARGRLERQKILDQSEAEKARKELLELEAMRWVERLTSLRVLTKLPAQAEVGVRGRQSMPPGRNLDSRRAEDMVWW